MMDGADIFSASAFFSLFSPVVVIFGGVLGFFASLGKRALVICIGVGLLIPALYLQGLKVLILGLMGDDDLGMIAAGTGFAAYLGLLLGVVVGAAMIYAVCRVIWARREEKSQPQNAATGE